MEPKEPKFLLRKDRVFLEATLDAETATLIPTEKKIDPRRLCHFGTEKIWVRDLEHRGGAEYSEDMRTDLRRLLYDSCMKTAREEQAEYLFVSTPTASTAPDLVSEIGATFTLYLDIN